MKTFTVTIETRERGAIGVFTPLTLTVKANDSAAAATAAIEKVSLVYGLEPRFAIEVLEQPQ